LTVPHSALATPHSVQLVIAGEFQHGPFAESLAEQISPLAAHSRVTLDYRRRHRLGLLQRPLPCFPRIPAVRVDDLLAARRKRNG
jgi:hypothetical protein